MRVRVLATRVPTPPAAPPVWRPFVIGALACTVTAGALTGALDLWTLRVAQASVPVDHHRAHGFAQVFGFVGLFVMGLSLHLAPRFFGQGPASRRRVRLLSWASLVGVAAFVGGRLGALLPGSAALGPAGAALVLLAFGVWAHFVWGLWRGFPGVKEALHRFLLAGALWWALGAATLLAWQLGQMLGGPLLRVPLEAAWVAALFGGAASWLWGIFFRAGLCTLHIARPADAAQQRLFVAWQAASGVAWMGTALDVAWLAALGQLALAGGVVVLWVTLRPLSGQGLGKEGALQARAVQAGLVLVLVFAGLAAWGAVASLVDAWAPPLLRDSARHAFTLGVALLVVGFAGRMVPGFSGVVLRWPRAYDAGVVALALGAVLRLAQLLGVTRAGLALAGASGGVAFLGVVLVSAALLGSLFARPKPVTLPFTRPAAPLG